MRVCAMRIRVAPPAARRAARRGFTLMEMLIVVAIIVILAGIGGAYMFGALVTARDGVAKAKIKTLEGQCELYRLNRAANNLLEEFPASLDVLLQPDPANGNKPYFTDPDALKDPWGNVFVYDPSGQNN